MTTLALAVLLLAQENQEPPQIFTLEVGGKTLSIEPGKPLELESAGKLSVILRLAPHRVFRHAGLTFHYPREYTFEADLTDPGVSNWTVSGNDHKVLLFRYKGRVDHEALLDTTIREMVGAYGADKVKLSGSELTLGKRTLKGRRMDVKLAGAGISQRLFSFKAGADSLLTILQDSATEDGQPTPEAVRGEALLKESFRFPE